MTHGWWCNLTNKFVKRVDPKWEHMLCAWDVTKCEHDMITIELTYQIKIFDILF